jgi:hypothetical protein
MTMKGKRVAYSYVMTVNASAEAIFPLLCPVREAEWIEVWEADIIYSESGVAEMGCVFTTDLPQRGPETWLVSRYEPDRTIELCRTESRTRVCHLSIVLEPGAGDVTRTVWTYTHTGLDEAGNQWVGDYTEERFRGEMLGIEVRLDHFLRTGEMLMSVDAHH